MLNWLTSALLIPVIIYLAIVIGMYLGQRKLIYRPDKTPVSAVDVQAIGAQLVETRSADGVTTSHLYYPAVQGHPTIIVFHGNAGNIDDRLDKAQRFIASNYGVIVVGYRGFGGNDGEPTEDGLYADARAALAFLQDRGVERDTVVLYGESLGTGVASKMAAEGRGFALILESPFTSVADVAQDHYWYLPARLLVHDRFDTLSRVGDIDVPVLIMHGERDAVVPFSHGQRLKASFKQEVQTFFVVPAAHTDLYDFGAMDAVAHFVGQQFSDPHQATAVSD